jgi:hypothetical protein
LFFCPHAQNVHRRLCSHFEESHDARTIKAEMGLQDV